MLLLPFTCDSAIYSLRFKTARHGSVLGGMGVRIYPKRMDARVLSPRAKRNPGTGRHFLEMRSQPIGANERDRLDEGDKKPI